MTGHGLSDICSPDTHYLQSRYAMPAWQICYDVDIKNSDVGVKSNYYDKTPWRSCYLKRSFLEKFIAVTSAFVIVFVISFYMNFETIHTIHHCTGEDCPICHQIHIAENAVRQLQMSIISCAVILFIPLIFLNTAPLHISSQSLHSLVTLKVRLDDWVKLPYIKTIIRRLSISDV